MDLFNIGFALFCLKITFCVLPGVAGVWCLAGSEDGKHELRRWIQNTFFDGENVIEREGFEKFLNVAGVVLIVLSLVACGLFLRGQLF
jgi:hypothetical protein